MIDTLRLSRRLFPDLKSHRLADMTNAYSIIVNNSHRALDDCISTYELYNSLHKTVIERYGSVDSFCSIFGSKSNSRRIDITKIVPTTDQIDIDHPLYNRECVFTGALERMYRKDAMQLVVNVGGKVADRITKNTNYLILGNNDFCKSIKEGKSNKQKKAEALKLSGQDIDIISELSFYDMFEL